MYISVFLYIPFLFVINSPTGHPVLWGMVVSHRVGIVRSDSAVAGGFWSRLARTEQEVQELWNRWPELNLFSLLMTHPSILPHIIIMCCKFAYIFIQINTSTHSDSHAVQQTANKVWPRWCFCCDDDMLTAVGKAVSTVEETVTLDNGGFTALELNSRPVHIKGVFLRKNGTRYCNNADYAWVIWWIHNTVLKFLWYFRKTILPV